MASLVLFAALSLGHPNYPRMELSSNSSLRFVSREAWGAHPPTGAVAPFRSPAQFVVIHHTYDPGLCTTSDQCVTSMRDMQRHHQEGNGWFDIGYNFAVGGEGSVYEGRGWRTVGAHTARTNAVSIGIAIIGDFCSSLPPAVALQATKQLIAEGVQRGVIRPDFKLVGHRQVSDTECPGDALFREIQSWDNFFCDSTKTQGHSRPLLCPELASHQLSYRETSFNFVSRAEWGANPAHTTIPLETPVSHVVIHHTAVPGVCMTTEQCMRDMRSMQNTHQNVNGWDDIGYNFAVGGEGSVYEGRGWSDLGAHAAGFNDRSIGIVIIGNYVSELPPAAALQTARRLVAEGVRRGFIRPDYRLVGHRQLTATSVCPGDALFTEIQSWDKFSSTV